MNIGLLGYGTVGGGVDELLRNRSDLSVTGIFSRTPKPGMGSRAAASFDALLSDPSIDTVVELIGGIHPALDFVTAALDAGKNVVTANKALIAAHYPALRSIAEASGAHLLFSAAAGGGIPWLKNLSRAAETDRIHKIRGVMNGTTNFILDRMTRFGADYGTALGEAQALGFAEADPSSDVDGNDTARKLVLSALVGFDVLLSEPDVPTFGIRWISPRDVEAAKACHAVIRLIGEAVLLPDGRVSAVVVPEFCPEVSGEAALSGPDNRFSYCGAGFGTQGFSGAGAGRYPTALNVVRDLLDLRSGTLPPLPKADVPVHPVCPGKERFYVRENDSVRTVSASREELISEVSGKPDVFIARLPEDGKESL